MRGNVRDVRVKSMNHDVPRGFPVRKSLGRVSSSRGFAPATRK